MDKMVQETSCLSVIDGYTFRPTDKEERKHKKNALILDVTRYQDPYHHNHNTWTAIATQQQQQQQWQQQWQWHNSNSNSNSEGESDSNSDDDSDSDGNSNGNMEWHWQQWWQLQDEQQSSNSKQEQSDWQSVVKAVVMVTVTTDQWRPQQWPQTATASQQKQVASMIKVIQGQWQDCSLARWCWQQLLPCSRHQQQDVFIAVQCDNQVLPATESWCSGQWHWSSCWFCS